MAEQDNHQQSNTHPDDNNLSKTSFMWVIKNYCNYPVEDNVTLKSSEITTNDGGRWLIKLRKGAKYLVVNVVSQTERKGLPAIVKVFFLFPNDFRCVEVPNSVQRGTNSTFTALSKNNYSHETYLLHGRHLIVYGIISVIEPESSNDERRSFKLGLPNLKESLATLLETGLYSDMTVTVDGKTFRSHKAILCSRSKHFNDLLNLGKSENEMKDSLTVSGIEPKTFETVLQFLYTGEVEVTESNVIQLLKASRDYYLPSLKSICEERLNSFFSVNNMLYIYFVSREYELEKLKGRALRMLGSFAKYVQPNYKLPSDENAGDSDRIPNRGISIFSNTNMVEQTNEQALNIPCCSPFINDPSFHGFNGMLHLPPTDVWCITESHFIADATWKIDVYYNEWETLSSEEVEGKIRQLKYFNDQSGRVRCMIEVYVEKQLDETVEKRTLGQKNISRTFDNEVETSENQLYLSLVLTVLSSPDNSPVNIWYWFSCLGNKGKMCTTVDSHLFEVNQGLQIFRINIDDDPLFEGGIYWLNYKCVERRSFAHEWVRFDGQNDELSEDISLLLEREQFADLFITVQGKTFYCHKALVASRCSFLQRTLEQCPDTNKLFLAEICPTLFEKFLACVYGNQYEALETDAWELLPFAHAFGMEDKEKVYENYLKSQLNLQNYAKMYEFSKRYGSDNLEKFCLSFISKYFTEIVELAEADKLFDDDDLVKSLFT